MPKPSPAPLTFYPAYCFPASPTFNTWAKLTAVDVHALMQREGFEGQNIYFHKNHPIKWIRLVGVILGFERYPYRWVILLDDFSGATIEITCQRDTAPLSDKTTLSGQKLVEGEDLLVGKSVTGNAVDLKGIDIGTIVKVKGGIREFREEKQITLERINIVTSTTEEVSVWNDLVQFRKSVLSKPWVISSEEEKRLKEEADGTKRRAEQKLCRQEERESKEERRRRRAEKGIKTSIPKESKRRTSDKENVGHNETGGRAGKGNKQRSHERQRGPHQIEGALQKTKVVPSEKPKGPVSSGKYDALGL